MEVFFFFAKILLREVPLCIPVLPLTHLHPQQVPVQPDQLPRAPHASPTGGAGGGTCCPPCGWLMARSWGGARTWLTSWVPCLQLLSGSWGDVKHHRGPSDSLGQLSQDQAWDFQCKGAVIYSSRAHWSQSLPWGLVVNLQPRNTATVRK